MPNSTKKTETTNNEPQVVDSTVEPVVLTPEEQKEAIMAPPASGEDQTHIQNNTVDVDPNIRREMSEDGGYITTYVNEGSEEFPVALGGYDEMYQATVQAVDNDYEATLTPSKEKGEVLRKKS